MQRVTLNEDKQLEFFPNLATHIVLLLKTWNPWAKSMIYKLSTKTAVTGSCTLDCVRAASGRSPLAAVSWRRRQELMTSALVTSGSTLQLDSSDALVCSLFLCSSPLTMSALRGASALVLAWVFLGTGRTAEAQTPTPAPRESLSWSYKLMGFVLSRESSQEAVTWRRHRGFSPIIWTEITIWVHGDSYFSVDICFTAVCLGFFASCSLIDR